MAQDTSAKILRKINEAKRDLVGKNVQGCLQQFKQALETAMKETVLPQDKKTVQEEIERFQGEIENSQVFKDIYGAVKFSGSEYEVALEFVKQLIQASAEELFESTDLGQVKEGQAEDAAGEDEEGALEDDRKTLLAEIMKKIAQDDLNGAREMIGEDEEMMDRVIDALNNDGISLRSSGKYDQALSAYSKGIELRPNEEGLYYNMARASFEKGDAPGALGYLDRVLNMNPDFGPGKDLKGYIQSKRSGAARADEPEQGSDGDSRPSNGKRGVFSALKGLIGKKRH